MGDPLSIRRATDADADAIAGIYAHYVRDGAITFEIDPPDGAEMAARMARIRPHYPFLAAEYDGSVVGYAYSDKLYERAAYRWATESTVYVAPSHQKRGIGIALYRTLIAALVDQGFQTVIAKITLPNPASVALHERLGFVRNGILAQVGFKQDSWHDVGLYQRELGPRSDHPPETRPFES